MNTSIIEQYTKVPDNLLALLSRYRVVIPGIQRHYVQGANNPKAESVREKFVRDIFKAIEDTECVFNLHFIYGPIDTNGEDSFVPVDGQQRLTTLWLITRYAIELTEDSVRQGLLRLLSRFTYEDRINAKRFCQALTNTDSRWDVANDPNPEILRQAWFLGYWKEDETVASIIRTLSTIHHEWQRHNFKAEQVFEAMGSRILFELKIDSFADDIYMKMNARGLQLTQWENFKSKFSEHLGDYKNTWEQETEELSNLFFTNSGVRHELPDDSFYALYVRIIAYELGKSNCTDAIIKLASFVHETWQQTELPFVPYTDFSNIVGKETSLFKRVAETCIGMIRAVLDNSQYLVPYFGQRFLFETFFHPKNNDDIDFTLCCYEYFKAFKDVNGGYFLQASRLIWNILENVSRQTNNIHNRISIIKQFAALGTPSLYSPVALETFTETDAAQVMEEAEKAVKMNDENQEKPSDWNETKLGEWIGWRHAIEYAESLCFFKGSIRFLYRDGQGKTTWENFATKLCNCIDLFSDDGLKGDKKIMANKALISRCKKWETIWRIPVFDSSKDNWKRILTNSSLAEIINSFLLSPDEIGADYDNILGIFLTEDTVWVKLIKDIRGYALEWKGSSPSLWLSRYLYCTLKLTRNNREDILDEFTDNPCITFEEEAAKRYLQISGTNYYYAIPVFFKYKYKSKEYRFAWQTWGWLDMYERDEKLYDKYYQKYGMGFNIPIKSEEDSRDADASYYLHKIEECIDKYENFIASIEKSK